MQNLCPDYTSHWAYLASNAYEWSYVVQMEAFIGPSRHWCDNLTLNVLNSFEEEWKYITCFYYYFSPLRE